MYNFPSKFHHVLYNSCKTFRSLCYIYMSYPNTCPPCKFLFVHAYGKICLFVCLFFFLESIIMAKHSEMPFSTCSYEFPY